ncbi:MAG TPA: hypothetical protein VHZ49_22080 [Methylomirabilota bacterium]|jgi:hypothetical protein|nr:hypothetical protein [Methylomirabilota bacterium]
MHWNSTTVMWSLAGVLSVLTLARCDSSVPTDPSALPRARAPRDWALSHAKETGAPTPDMPRQHPPNQGGDARTLNPATPARADATTR